MYFCDAGGVASASLWVVRRATALNSTKKVNYPRRLRAISNTGRFFAAIFSVSDRGFFACVGAALRESTAEVGGISFTIWIKKAGNKLPMKPDPDLRPMGII